MNDKIKTAKQIFEEQFWRTHGQTLDTYLIVTHDEGEYSMSGGVMPDIIKAMEEYAEQKVFELLERAKNNQK